MDVQSMGQPTPYSNQSNQDFNFETLYFKMKVENLDLQAINKVKDREIDELNQNISKFKEELPRAEQECKDLNDKLREQSSNLEQLEKENHSLKQKITLLQQDKSESNNASSPKSNGPPDDSVSW